ncbi:MAG: glycerophosphodiester phosphodiesterase [Anaerolineae bacterium]|nr:glycerophosphodiester phosphodiesterase [Anaerolineae bacterium]
MSGVRTSPVRPPDQRPAWSELAPMPVSRVSQRKPIIVGHRGAKGLAPENTLAAFQVAADLGIDGAEFDVQRTKDGQLIVFHDEDVERVCGVAGFVPDMTLDEIKQLDAGSLFAPEFKGERIPTLAEAFAFLKQTDLLLFLELKEPWRYPGIEAEVAALIRQYDLVERIQVRSFYHDGLYGIHAAAPEIPLSELWLDRLPADDDITFNTVNALFALLQPADIARLHARGLNVTAWVVNELDEAQRLIEAGIDGLATDYPDQLLTLFAPDA